MNFAECLLEQSIEPSDAAALLTRLLGVPVQAVNDLVETLDSEGPHVVCSPARGDMRSQLLIVGLGADTVVDRDFYATIGDATEGGLLIPSDSTPNPYYFELRIDGEWKSVALDADRLDDANEYVVDRVVVDEA